MARTLAELPAGSRITDYISLGVLAGRFPRVTVDRVLRQSDKSDRRQRDLPAPVMVYYVIALALYMQVSYREVLRCLLEGLHWLRVGAKGPSAASRSGISRARIRLGAEPLRRLHDEVVRPIAGPDSRGAWRRGWRLVSIDGSVLDLADEPGNVQAFGRPGASRGVSAYPQLRFVALLENGTHVLFGSRMGAYAESEIALARQLLPALDQDMLCLADRNFFGYPLWKQARGTGADLLWRVKKNLRLPVEQTLSDGSYLSRIYSSDRDRRRQANGIAVRVIEYRLEGVADAEPLYRLLTSLLDPAAAPAAELAALYHQRWEIETAFDELKTHLRGSKIVLRSKTPELVRQEFWGLLLAHFAIRDLMQQAAQKGGRDPDSPFEGLWICTSLERRRLELTVPGVDGLAPQGRAAEAKPVTVELGATG